MSSDVFGFAAPVRSGTRLARRARALLQPALLMTGLASACGVRRAPAGAHSPPCLETDGLALRAEWILAASAQERSALDAWCWAVGPALHTTLEAADAPPIDGLAVVVWNVAVGHGDITALIDDLRSGALTGAPVKDFVLLLQEVHREGRDVPAVIPDWSATPARIGDPAADRIDVRELAARAGLSLVYAPSMRNGRASDGGPPEDRGNAILSTLPLHDPAFIELPFERQRRVAVLASVRATSSSGEPWTLRFASVHFDNRARISRILRSFGAAHLRQARWLTEVLRDTESVVVGGDLNTWSGGRDAASVQLLREHFPLPERHPTQGTADLPWFLPDLPLDHLFFRLPARWDAEYRVAEDAYGSDHRPLVGRVRVSG